MAKPSTDIKSFWKFIMDDIYGRKHQPVFERVAQSVVYDKLINYASSLRSGVGCRLAPQWYYDSFFVFRMLEFDDGVEWLVRILADEIDNHSMALVKSEVDITNLAREHSLPAPEIYGYVLDREVIGRPFILSRPLPGNVLVHVKEAYDRFPDLFPMENSDRLPDHLLRQLAELQVRMTSIRLPYIGRLIKDEDGEVAYWPCPKMSRIHTSTRAYLEDYGRLNRRIPCERIKRYTRDEAEAKRVEQDMFLYPLRVKQIAKTFGPDVDGTPAAFPVTNPDMATWNIVVDDKLNLVGIDQWRDVRTQPWALVAPPMGVASVLLELVVDRPDEIRDRVKLMWEEQIPREQKYIQFVKEWEQTLGTDTRLSAALENRPNRCLHHSLGDYEAGYCRALHRVPLMFGIYPSIQDLV